MKSIKKAVISAVIITLSFSVLFAKGKEKQPLKAEQLQRPPLLRMTDNGFRLIWNDNKPSAAVTLTEKGAKTVRIQPVTGTVSGKDSGFYADFENLTPGKTYTYKISGHKKASFTVPSSDSPFTFAAISDHQTFPELTEKGFNCVASEKPDCIISAGDMLEDGKVKNWNENFFQKIPLLNGIPFAAAEGNNDTGFELFKSYLGLENRYYSCTYGNTRFLMINTNLPVRPDSEQYAWLEKTLSENKSRWTVAVFHKGAYLSSVPDKSFLKVRDDLIPLLEKYGTDLIINGHNHFYDRTSPINGITHVSLPCMSGSITKIQVNENSGYYGKTIPEFRGYAVCTVTKDSIHITVKDLDGTVRDDFVINKKE